MRKITILLIVILLWGCVNNNEELGFLENQNEKSIELIAHRGAKNIAPEHTLSSYAKAIELGADYIEIDLQLTKDGHLVALHDITVDATTNGNGKVSELTLDELKKLDAGSWFNEKYEGEKIPTLTEIFDEFEDRTKYYIETRLVEGLPVMEEQLIELLTEKKLLGQAVIQSFSAESLKEVHRINQDLPLIQLVFGDNLDSLNGDEIKEYAIGVGPYARQIDKEFVERMQSVGLRVYVWFDISNEKELMPEIISYGVDGVFTDFLTNTEEVIGEI